MERFPEKTSVGIQDFRNCRISEILDNVKRDEYSSIWQSLSDAAKKAIEDKKYSEGKVLWLLADACSMMLRPSSLNEPFAPFMVMEGKRSALPQDFKNDDIQFFSEIVTEIEDKRVKARISEILWLLKKPRTPQNALDAIDSYCEINISTDSWVGDGRKCWERAIQLCLMLGKGSGERLNTIKDKLINKFRSLTSDDGYLSLWISEILHRYNLANEEPSVIAEKMETLAIQFENEGDLWKSRDHFVEAEIWYKKNNRLEKAAEMAVRAAEGWVKEAIARQASSTPSQMAAASFYENAIQKYRTIPKAFREAHNVDSRISELRSELNKAGEGSLEEMGVISSPSIDISELVQNARNAVSGKPPIDALLALSNIYPGAKVKKIRSFSEELLSKHPLQALFSATHMSRDGRVIAKRPGADLNGGNYELTVWAEMVKQFGMELGIIVQGKIWPALVAMRLEHRLTEADFLYIVKQSPIVPPGREHLIAKALFSGYDNDFTVALHLLVPQIEHLVRFHLKQVGVKTTNLDINGIENENGLSTLIDSPEVEKIFGEDLFFEIKALFCDSFGPNLRNELAHGLIDFEESRSIYSIYAWWVVLRIIFNTFWNAKNQNTSEDDSNDEGNIENT